MFRQTAHASSMKFGLLMTLKLAGWHLQGRKCVWKRILLIVLQMILKSFSKPLRTKKRAIYFSYHQPLFFSLPARVATRKINLGVGVLVQDPMIVMTLNLTGWHLQVRKCVWNRILLIVRNENWKPSKTPRTSTHPIYFFVRQQRFSFFPARVATRKINLGWVY